MHHVCYSHVQHTHKQVDNAPCPAYEYLEIVVPAYGCSGEGDAGACIERKSEEWSFDTEVEGKTPNDLWGEYRRRLARSQAREKSKAEKDSKAREKSKA